MFVNPCRVGVMRASMPMGTILKTSYDACKSYIVLFCCIIKRFTLLSVLWPYCVFVSLYQVRVTFLPMLSCLITVPNVVLYLSSKFAHEVPGHPVYNFSGCFDPINSNKMSKLSFII